MPMSSTYGRKSTRFSRNRHAHVVQTQPFNPSHLTQVQVEVKGEEEDEFASELKSSSTHPTAVETLQEKEDEESRVGFASELMSSSDLRRYEIDEDVNDVVSQLEELRLAAEEAELSEEQLRINNQLQEDELLAMEAIYGDNLTLLGRQDGQKSFQVHIYFDIPDELAVSAKLLYSSNENVKFEGTSTTPKAAEDRLKEGFLYSFKVQHLPPIMLTCLLPKSYPSHQPPCFNISIQWLDPLRISNLCGMLDSLWINQPGQEVIYQWVEWLHTSSLLYLGIDKEIILGPYNMEDTADRRAVSGSVSPEVDISSMMNYNDGRCHEVFRENLQECCICFSEYPGMEFVRLPCKHFFCWKCMETYSNIHVKEGTVNKLLCPDAKCGELLPPSLLERLLGKEEFERWESLLLQKTLESMSDVVYCPRCETACLEDEDHHAQCQKCFFSFCSICGEQRHVGITCMRPEMKLQVLMERQESPQLGNDQKRREQEKINEILSLDMILGDSKQCPSCKMAIYRNEGCNRMVCGNCGRPFCYQCTKPINGYDHFMRADGCALLTPETIQEWKERMNGDRPVGRKHQCPICKHMNSLVGNNNLVFCRSCQNQYCYLCRKNVWRSTQHYGPNGDCTERTRVPWNTFFF